MIEKLKNVLKQEDTVLFIGSGVSLWSGLPSWTGIINELIEFLKANGLDPTLTEQEFKRGDLLQAASYGFDKLTKHKFAEFIRKTCRLSTAKPHEIHNKIISLGPNCYITTNYDKLLELSFHKWIPEIYFRSVVNKQLTETAEIVGARAKNFLFKLHGDAEDSDSIILTREQYRALNFGGELYHALETTKILMVSRPIVYIGFGLRDPDFLYLKDLLINTYKGGTRDHYAIMADVSDQEKDYWRRNFGIHLIGYKTIDKEDGTKDHSPILDLLDELKSTKVELQTSTLKLTPEFVLGLNRHAAKYSSFENSKLHLPLVVNTIENRKSRKDEFYLYRYYEWPIENLLDNGPDKLILIGLPGGGKSYSLKGSVARLAKELNKGCIEDSIKVNETVIPIYTDLKLYQGSIIDLIEQNIPVGMSMNLLCSNFKVKLYLDAFNEIPKEYIESNHWNSDLANLLQTLSFSLVISSRTIDGLESIEFPGFNLDSINKDFIKQSLAKNEIELKGLFEEEIVELLRKPFFYKLIFENRFKIASDTSPQKIYADLIKLINNRFQERFQIDLNLSNPLSKAGLNAIDNGDEAYKVEELKNYIKYELEKINSTDVSEIQVINWLVSQDFLVPIINERISFFHQSVTEYLAATRLARLYINNNKILNEKLRYRRWDQALFLTLSLLEKSEADKFLKNVIAIDFEMALSSIKYMESDTREIVNRLLIEIDSKVYDDFDKMSQISHLLRHNLPISELHTHLLKKLINKGNSLGGAAVGCLLDLSGYGFKDQVLNLLVDKCDDYNFCTEIGRSLEKYITIDDLPLLLNICKQVQEKLDSKKIKRYEGFDSALGDLLEGFEPNLIYHTFFDPAIPIKRQKVQLDVLLDFLDDCRNSEGLKISMNLLLAGIEDVVVEIHFILCFSKEEDNIDYSIFKLEHIKSLLTIIKRKKNDKSDWALSSLTSICSRRDDLIPYVLEEIKSSSGVLKAALYYSISKANDHKLVFGTLTELLNIDSKEMSKEPFDLISHMDKLEWKGQEKLFVELLRLRNMKLAYNLCDKLVTGVIASHYLILDIGSIKWWLDWFMEYFESKNKDWMFIDRVPSVISTYISIDKRNEFIKEFNDPNSQYRSVISRIIFRKLEDLTIDEFTEEAITYLLDELKSIKLNLWVSSILINIATESFVNERLIPLLKSKKGIEQKNLKEIIEKIGKKHERRYLVE